MATLKRTLENIWNNNDFCCLCFTVAEDSINVEDEIYISQVNDNNLTVSELLCSVLGYEVLDYLFTFKHVCKLCIQSAISCYNFIKTSKSNSNLLFNSINDLLSSLEYTEDEIKNCNTLFVSLNTDDFTSQQFYDVKKRVTSMSMARNRYNFLNSLSTSCKSEYEEENTYIHLKKKLLEGKPMLHNNSAITSDMYSKKYSRCKECYKVFKDKVNLRNHYVHVHASKVYKCTECNRAFDSQSYLEVHKSESHTTYVCSKCGKTFKNKKTFEAHETGHTIICQDCGRTYKSKSTYKKHKELNICGQWTRASPANAKYTCDYCKKKYTQKVSLRVHIQYEHGNYKHHVCNVCNKKFWAQSRLKAHMVKHTRERNFTCTLCDGKFVTKTALLYHTRRHTGEKPYECDQCDARFLSASRRSEHIKRYHLNATVECDICGSMFSSQSFLQKHKKSHINNSSSEKTLFADCLKLSSNQKVNKDDFIKYTPELKRITKVDTTTSAEEIYLEFDI